jgi:hypothetical protein
MRMRLSGAKRTDKKEPYVIQAVQLQAEVTHTQELQYLQSWFQPKNQLH